MKDLPAIEAIQQLLKSNRDSSDTMHGTLPRTYVRALNHLIKRVATSRDVDSSVQLIQSIKHADKVRCPICGNQSGLLDDFSLLKADFNGIKEGDRDDLDLQECGKCGAKLHWDYIT